MSIDIEPIPDSSHPLAPASQVVIREWHTLTPVEQVMEWTALVNWVIWLHDQYELSREERLPLCWTRHPGLVEELRSLKAWRDTIYDTPETRSAAHTARSWHGELRQTITAATTFWARRCRAGHRDAEPLVEAHPTLAAQWHQAPPPLMATSTALRTVIDDEDMTTLLDDGRARRHTDPLAGYVTFAGAWWQQEGDCQPWRRVVDPAHHSTLEKTLARMTMADTAATTVNQR